MRNLSKLILPVAFVALLACGNEVVDPTPRPVTQTPEDQEAPEFEGGGQKANIGEPIYPGPYGVGIGSVIPNYKFFGFPRANVDSVTFREIQLADFWNPTGDGVYPPGSPYGEGTPKPKALVLDRSAVWCPPCKEEAAVHIPQKRLKYAPAGEFFVTLDDGTVPGVLATEGELRTWVTNYNIDYPAVIDPNSTLAAIVGRDAYPGNVIVRTRDMKIVHWVAGIPQSPFWAKFEAVLADQPVLPGD
jgi:hypothetical protein